MTGLTKWLKIARRGTRRWMRALQKSPDSLTGSRSGLHQPWTFFSPFPGKVSTPSPGEIIGARGSYDSTGIKPVTRLSMFKEETYRRAAGELDESLGVIGVSRLLGGASAELAKKWAAYEGSNDDVDDIVEEFVNIYSKAGVEGTDDELKTETQAQIGFNCMLEALENALDRAGFTRYLGRHNSSKTPIDGGRKPDGVLKIYNSEISWKNLVVAFELKGSDRSITDPVLRGQLSYNLVHMAQKQPRRFMFAIGIARSTMRVYVYSQGELIHYDIIGMPYVEASGDRERVKAIPSSKARGKKDSIKENGKRVFQFLKFLYLRIGEDYGLVTQESHGIYSTIHLESISATGPSAYLASIQHLNFFHLPEGSYSSDPWIHSTKYLGGRYFRPTGSHTWLFKGEMGSANACTQDVIIKIGQSTTTAHSEIETHRMVYEMDVPNIPKIHLSGMVPRLGTKCELLVMEYAGVPIMEYMAENKSGSSDFVRSVVNIFAGYVYSLVAADRKSDQYQALHRDISVGNLLVLGHDPRVIDWGFGLVLEVGNPCRSISHQKVTGTTPYMGCRILSRAIRRSVFDDVESTFLVLCFVLWNIYSQKLSSRMVRIWNGDEDLESLSRDRSEWLRDEATFIDDLGLINCPAPFVELVLVLYRFLFTMSELGGYGNIVKSFLDPRVEWLSFSSLAQCFRIVVDDHFPGVDISKDFEQVAELERFAGALSEDEDKARQSLEYFYIGKRRNEELDDQDTPTKIPKGIDQYSPFSNPANRFIPMPSFQQIDENGSNEKDPDDIFHPMQA